MLTCMLDLRSDALALKYQGYYGTAHRDLQISDLVNDSVVEGEFRIFGLGLPEKFFDKSFGNFGSLFQNCADSPLIRKNIA